MKRMNTRVLNGPNYWSNYRKQLIVLRVDLEEYENFPSNTIDGFNTALKQLLPSLYEHRCSIGTPGGFFTRLDNGTWLGHIIEHVALELQTLAGMDCGFGRTYSTSKLGVYDVIFAYEIEEAGLYAGEVAFSLIESLAAGKPFNELEFHLETLRTIFENERLGPSTEAIVNEAKKRKIPVSKVKNSSLIALGHGCNQKKMWATLSFNTSSLGVDIAANKELTKSILSESFIPVPKGLTISDKEELDNAIELLEFPLVAKPHNGNHGRGIMTHIDSKEKAFIGFKLAKKISNTVIIEHMIKGDDYRFLVINFKLVAVAKRTPAMIVGNGVNTIAELIERANADPKRGVAHENVLTAIKIDEATHSLLKEKNLTLNSVVPKDYSVYLKGTANLSAGGTAKDVTDLVHIDNIKLAEKIARLINLDICGIDIVCESVETPINKNNGAVIEVNAGPGLRMHLHPTEGLPRNVAAPILDMLYPAGQPATIPIVAVTGTNGKTTVVRLVAHLAKSAKFHVGFTTTEGIYCGDQLIYSGDCSGPLSATCVLSDPLVNYAVLECARGGILRSGLAFDECDISIITNITEDHLGLKGIDSLEDLLDVKSVVAHSTKKNGCTILNADDNLLLTLKDNLKSEVALFGLTCNESIHQHCENGGLACYLENGIIIIHEGISKYPLAQIQDIPIAFNGAATCMIQNILPAVLAAVRSNISFTNIAKALYDFLPTSDFLPGRMNVFHFDRSEMMLDYAHNEGAFIELKNYLGQIKNKRKIGIIGATGDRRPADIKKIGFYSAQIFDEIIIRHDKDGRGKTNEQLTSLLMQGITNASSSTKVHIISDEFAAVEYALDHSTVDSFIFYTPEDVFAAIEFIKQVQKSRANNPSLRHSYNI